MSRRRVLKLYIAGGTAASARAVANLRSICENDLGDSYELRIIDVSRHPDLAEKDRIAATPTLLKELPEPIRRIVGDLSDRQAVLLGLDVSDADDTDKP